MVKGGVPASAAQVVLNHHQRFDGSGYPARVDHATGEALPPLAGKQIPVFSRIAILADIYDAATTTRCYSAAKPPVQVLHEMRTRLPRVFRSGGRGGLLPHGAGVSHRPGGHALRRRRGGGDRFQRRVSPAAEGAMPAVGRRPAAGPSCGLEEIDLALYSDLSIVAVNGRDVRPFVQWQDSVETPELV